VVRIARDFTEDVAAAEVAASRCRAATDVARRGSLARRGLCEPSAASLGLAALVGSVVALVAVAGRSLSFVVRRA